MIIICFMLAKFNRFFVLFNLKKERLEKDFYNDGD